MLEPTVEPRIKLRIAAVTAQRDQDFTAKRVVLVEALKIAISSMDRSASSRKQRYLMPLIETYRWALDELESMAYGGYRETERINAICTLLRNISRELPDAQQV